MLNLIKLLHFVQALQNFRYLSIAVLILSYCPVAAAQKDIPDEIFWGHIDFPGMFNPQAPDAGLGVGDIAYAALQKKMPAYRHRQLHANVLRITKEVQHGNACSVFFSTPKRRKKMHFSNPVVYVPSYKVYVPDIEAIVTNELQGTDISLQSIFTVHTNFRLGVSTHSYGTRMDKVLRSLEDSPNVVKRAGVTSPAGLIKMLVADRIDGVLESPIIFNYMTRFKSIPVNLKPISLTQSPIALGLPVACAKTPRGKKITTEINQKLENIRGELQAAVEYWLSPAQTNELRKAYDQNLLNALLQESADPEIKP